MTTIRFDDALRLAAKATLSNDLPAEWPVRVIRDVFGRIRFAINCNVAQYPAEAQKKLRTAQGTLGAFATSDEPLFREDFADPDAVFESADWHLTMVQQGLDEEGVAGPDIDVLVLDRQITGQDWLRPPPSTSAHPHRLVFFGLKGGVGRSTALAMVAWGLARIGKRVLLVDFDLESPGLSGLLLPPERVAEFGLVDWLVEDAVGQGDSVLSAMVSVSPLAETTTGAIRVAAAIGQSEQDYLAKLARAYADVPGKDGPQRMGARMRTLVELLEAHEQPDVVLIDSRAGLHDLAAVSITSLADTALLFATDSTQNWQGYRQLFMHWQRRPDVGRRVRERLAVVRALMPKSDRERSVKLFQEHAYALFAETLYDEIGPVAAGAPAAISEGTAPFHPAMGDEAAPHFPILLDWDERFQEFNPTLRPEQGGASDAQIEASFGALIHWVRSRIDGV